jgi:predicted CXXCH cytochrome family protein
MLPQAQADVCMGCHGSTADVAERILRGDLSSGVEPQLLLSDLNQAYTHQLDRQAYSEHETGVVTCTSCHSAHRGVTRVGPVDDSIGGRKPSPKDPSRFEYELCESCHGSRGSTTVSLTDISRLLNPGNPSYHPVEAAAVARSPSLLTELAGEVINCTDCHGNADPGGSAGPHGSPVRYLLAAGYSVMDGPESPETYALCYRCHDRKKVLEFSPFPLHEEHIVEAGASCATCHNPHGSVGNRALIRFGEETVVAGVSPSPSTGLLRFESEGPGSGACFLSCHGVDHAPEAYGALRGRYDKLLRGLRERGPMRAPVNPAGSTSR